MSERAAFKALAATAGHTLTALPLLLTGSLVYEQLGYKAFGMPGKLAASCSITMQNIGGEEHGRSE